MSVGVNNKTFKIQFDSMYGPGKLVPDFKDASKIVFEGKEHLIAPGALRKRETPKDGLEEKLEKKISSLDAFIASIDYNALLDKNTLYEDRIVEIDGQINLFNEQWVKLMTRHDHEGERTPELLADLSSLETEFNNYFAEIKHWRADKKEDVEFLNEKENKGWEEQFKKASACITESYPNMDDFKLKNPSIAANLPDDAISLNRDHRNFEFDLKQVLLDCAGCPDKNGDPFAGIGRKEWVKIFAAARMINDKRTPKKFIIIGGQTYAFEDAKSQKVFDKESIRKARESLQKIVHERLQKSLQEKGIKNVNGRAFDKKGDIRYLTFEIARNIIEDNNNFDIVLNNGIDSPLLDDEKKKIDEIIAEMFKDGGNKEVNKLLVRTFVYNKIGVAISEDPLLKSKSSDEKVLKQRMSVDDVLQSFDAGLQAKIAAFIDKREQPGFEKAKLDKELEEEILKAVKKFISNDSAITVSAEPSKSVGTETEKEEVKEKNKKPEKKTEKELVVDEVTALFEKLQNKIKEIPGKKDDKDLGSFVKYAEDILQELSDATDVDKRFRLKSEDIKKRINEKLAELIKDIETQKDTFIHSLVDLNHKLLDGFDKIKDYIPAEEKGDLRTFIDTVGDSSQELHDTEKFDEKFKRKGEDLKKRIEVKLIEIEKIVADKTEADKKVEEERAARALVERVKLAKNDGEQGLEELKKNVDLARKKYDDVYNDKAEKYKEIVAALGGNKEKIDTLMMNDGDIAFYLEDYQQLLQQYLKASIESTDTKNDSIIEQIKLRTPKPNWFTKQLYKFSDLLNAGTPKFTKENQDKKAIELLPPEKNNKKVILTAEAPKITETKTARVSNSASSDVIGNEAGESSILNEEQPQEIEIENKEFEYSGGAGKLRKDLLSAMLMIVEDEKNIVHAVLAGESSGKLRDMKIKDLLTGKHAKDFGRISKEGRLIIANIARIKELDVMNRDLTLRSFIMEALAYSKSMDK